MTHTATREIGLPLSYEIHTLSEGQSGIVYDCHGQRMQTDHLSEPAAAFIVKAVNAFEELEHALQVILPMAKGYAHQNQVGSNAEKIEFAEAILAKVQS